MQFTRTPHPAPTPDVTRATLIADPGFGTVFTDHMVVIDYDEALGGWQTPTIGPRGPIALDPAASVLHYAQEIFEGMKAFAHADGGLALFRPEANAQRFNASARRMAMPEIPEDLFLAAVREAVLADANWLPPIRRRIAVTSGPSWFASEAFLGVRPAKQYKFMVIISAAGNYFRKGVNPVKIWVSQDYVRAAPRRHRRGQDRRQLRRVAGSAGRSHRQGLRSGGVPRCSRTPLGRGVGRHESVLRPVRRLCHHPRR